jgi:hypothetical protein
MLRRMMPGIILSLLGVAFVVKCALEPANSAELLVCGLAL